MTEPMLAEQAQEPLRRLARATLSRAIEDANGADQRPAHSAARWLAGYTMEGLTLEHCCDLLGIAPARVHSSLRRHYPTIWQRMVDYSRLELSELD